MFSSLRPRLVGTLTVIALSSAALAVAQPEGRCPVVVSRARVTIAGSSNVLAWSASTTAARTANVVVTNDLPGGDFFWVGVLQPGAVTSFDLIVPVNELTSDRDNFTADLHKALRADQYPTIVFSLTRLEKRPGGAIAYGTLSVAGVTRDVVLPVVTSTRDGALWVTGSIDLVMTDFGIEPPTAMLGSLKTDPKVTVRFETVLVRQTT